MVKVQCVPMRNACDREDADGAQPASVGLTCVREHPCLCVHAHGEESGKHRDLDAQVPSMCVKLAESAHVGGYR